MTSNMANTFFWKHSDSLDAKCKQEASVIRGVIGGLISAFLIVSPVSGQYFAEAEGILKSLKEAEEAEKVAAAVIKRTELTVARETRELLRRRRDAEMTAFEAGREAARIQQLELEGVVTPADRVLLETALRRSRRSIANEERAQAISKRVMEEAKLDAKEAKQHAVVLRIRGAAKHWEGLHNKNVEPWIRPVPPKGRGTRVWAKHWSKITSGAPSAIPFGLSGLPMAVSQPLLNETRTMVLNFDP